MNIFKNIPGFYKAVHALKYMKPYQKAIHEARAAGDKETERRNILRATSEWSKELISMFGATLEVRGKENIPAEGPFVIVSNHQGYGDIIILCAALDKVPFGFVAKRELAKIPFYGKWITDIKSVFIERDSPRDSRIPGTAVLRHNGFPVPRSRRVSASRSPDAETESLLYSFEHRHRYLSGSVSPVIEYICQVV